MCFNILFVYNIAICTFFSVSTTFQCHIQFHWLIHSCPLWFFRFFWVIAHKFKIYSLIFSRWTDLSHVFFFVSEIDQKSVSPPPHAKWPEPTSELGHPHNEVTLSGLTWHSVLLRPILRSIYIDHHTNVSNAYKMMGKPIGLHTCLSVENTFRISLLRSPWPVNMTRCKLLLYFWLILVCSTSRNKLFCGLNVSKFLFYYQMAKLNVPLGLLYQ